MDRDFNFNFPFSGDLSTPPPPPPLWNFPPPMIDDTQTTLFSDPTPLLHQTLLPFPYDNFSFNNSYSDSTNLPLSKIPKLEQFSPSSAASAHRFSAAENLPPLRSFESPTSFDSYFTNLTSNHHQTLQSVVPDHVNIVNNLMNINNNNTPPPTLPPPPPPPGSKRKRSQRIGDKYRILQKLMPWDKKMDTACMLGEAYKYIKFMQAQVKALETMPDESSAFRCENGAFGSVFGALGMLSRKEMLQVVLNSPEVQTMLCSECRCVFSIEQLVRFRELINWL